jgi:hypothetical protein
MNLSNFQRTEIEIDFVSRSLENTQTQCKFADSLIKMGNNLEDSKYRVYFPLGYFGREDDLASRDFDFDFDLDLLFARLVGFAGI